ncbi:hypothetical protein CAPTEDRAFT_211445 [Capitella teleta]|uniref:Uncharacterized protein n=1 Tax=Capitella teleta TaxID=283909 RepID=R7TEA0_CAPTE|nr:hypothetical protein CAPTEDRAFT_137352 [Capitella teleta]ELT97981.1 hypothetical protein CAPTEDRAFT_211445 [Capitella teleta]|eukprot:ELT92059.1 hypothetical protein CAPTEDRAFT_137352 [Capitella teleta]
MTEEKESKEDTALVKKDNGDLEWEISYCRYALVCAYVTVIGFFLISMATLVIALRNSSVSGLAVALETLLDSVTSIVVIWRFSGPISRSMLYSNPRERVACIACGSLCFLVSLILCTRSAISLVTRVYETPTIDLLYVLSVSGTLGLILFSAKLFIAAKLGSLSILTDAISSGIGALLAITAIGAYYANVWYLDGAIGILAGAMLATYGAGIVTYEMCSGDK